MSLDQEGVAIGATLQSFAATVPGCETTPVSFSRGQEVLHPSRETYLDVVGALKAGGFNTCSDLCAVDYLSAATLRPLPDGVIHDRFELVVSLLSHSLARRVRLRVQIPESDPTCETLFFLYPGVENMEREVYDLFGIAFVGHPDMTRILMPEDWEGHPLRKDYPVEGYR